MIRDVFDDGGELLYEYEGCFIIVNRENPILIFNLICTIFCSKNITNKKYLLSRLHKL